MIDTALSWALPAAWMVTLAAGIAAIVWFAGEWVARAIRRRRS